MKLRVWSHLLVTILDVSPYFILLVVNITVFNLCHLQACICGFSIATGGAYRLILGYDSYGNTCGRNNTKIDGVPLSGRDMTDKKLVTNIHLF